VLPPLSYAWKFWWWRKLCRGGDRYGPRPLGREQLRPGARPSEGTQLLSTADRHSKKSVNRYMERERDTWLFNLSRSFIIQQETASTPPLDAHLPAHLPPHPYTHALCHAPATPLSHSPALSFFSYAPTNLSPLCHAPLQLPTLSDAYTLPLPCSRSLTRLPRPSFPLHTLTFTLLLQSPSPTLRPSTTPQSHTNRLPLSTLQRSYHFHIHPPRSIAPALADSSPLDYAPIRTIIASLSLSTLQRS
jgi:hypothetical protein